jgi:copper chaperone CopZ
MISIEDIQITHYVPGRVRLKSRQLRGASALAQRVTQSLGSVPGVQRVEVNALTGSVLLLYDRKALAADGSLAALKKVIQSLFPALDPNGVLRWLKETA